MKFLKIAKESIELYVPIKGQRKGKVPPWMTKRVLQILKYKCFMEKIIKTAEVIMIYVNINEYKIELPVNIKN